MRLLPRAALVLAAAILAGCNAPTDRRASASRTSAAGPQSASAPADTAALVPIDAPGILAQARDGRARATIVNVWATWCVPCREEFPALIAAARAHRVDGVRLLLVSTDFEEQLPDVRRFLAQHAVRDTTYLKHGGDQPFIDGLNPKWSGTIPATFVYDAAGRPVTFWEGRADSTRFESAIQRALGVSRPSTKEAHS